MGVFTEVIWGTAIRHVENKNPSSTFLVPIRMYDSPFASAVPLLPVGRVDSQSPAIDLIAIQVPHGHLGRVRGLVLAEAEALRATSFTILDDSAILRSLVYSLQQKCLHLST